MMTADPRPPGEARTVRELLEHALGRFPDRVAFRRKNPVGYGIWTYRDVNEYVRRFSGALLELGVRKGDRFALLADNSPEWAVACFTIASIGAVAVPLDRMMSAGQIASLLARTGARWAVAARAFTPAILEAIKQTPTIERVFSMEQPHDDGVVMGFEDLLALGERCGRDFREVQVAPEDPLMIAFTPGTTGTSKGVMITHGNIAFEAGALHRVNPWAEDDCGLSLLPMSQLHEFMAGFVAPFVSGCPVVYINSLVPSKIVEAFGESRVTRIAGMPLLFTLMYGEVAERVEKLSGLQKFLYFRSMDIARTVRQVTGKATGGLLATPLHAVFGDHLREAIVGGARMDPETVDRILDAGVPLYLSYGLTEASAVSTFGSAAVVPRGSAGAAVPGVTLSIAAPNSDGVGEIRIAGESVMAGYLADPQRTARALEGGTLGTRDLGYLDDDGNLFVIGRMDAGQKTDELERQYAALKLVRERAGAPAPAAPLVRYQQAPHSFHEFLRLNAECFGDRVAFSYFRDGAWTLVSHRELFARSEEVARALRAAGLKVDDRAAILGESSAEWITHLFGVILAGGVAIPLDPKLTPVELGNIVRHAEPRFVCCAANYLETARDLRNAVSTSFKVWNFDDKRFESLLDPEPLPPDPRPWDRMVLMSYTSGSSGTPKGVMLSARALLFEAQQLQQADPAQDTVTLSILPLNHLYGLSAGLFLSLRCGTEICMATDLSPQAIVNCLRTRRVTRLLAVPLFAKMLLRGIKKKLEATAGVAKRGLFAAMVASMARAPIRPLQNLFFKQIHEGFGGTLREMVCGGAALDPETASFFNAINIPVYIGYGLTETGPVVSMNSPAASRPRTVGRVMSGCEVRIERKNPGDFGGEIWIRGPNVMNGYYKNPGLTAESITPEGWFRSGDVGWMDEDGFLYVMGRQKALIVLASGKKVHPEEVEDVLAQSPLIKDVCVIGLPARGEAGETTAAVIFPTEDAAKAHPDRAALEAAVRKSVAELCEDLATFKRPVRVIVRDKPFVMTTSMKIKRDALRAELEQTAPRPSVDRRLKR